MERQLVVFTLDDEYFGVDIFSVERIVDLPPVVRVPHSPAFIKGITNLYGDVLPVLDLRKRFALPAVPPTRDSRIVVVEIQGVKVGMLVDAVSEVMRVDDAYIVPPPDIVLTSVNRAYILSIVKLHEQNMSDMAETHAIEKQLVILLNLAEVLSAEEKADLQRFEQTLAEEDVLLDAVARDDVEFMEDEGL